MMSASSAHPPLPRAPPACKRCSLNKKKCDRRVPRCTACVTADASCEPMVKAADRRLMRQMEDMREESIAMKRQIADLQQELRARQAGEYGAKMNISPTSNALQLPGLPLLFLTSNEHPVMSRTSRHLCPLQYIFTSFDLQHVDCSSGLDHPNLQPWAAANDLFLSGSTYTHLLPSMDEVQKTIMSLAEASKHGPSNLDKIVSLSQLQEDCRVVYGPRGLEAPEYATSRFRCFITVYLAMSMAGAASAENVTTDPQALACLAVGFRELGSMTDNADFTCVEAFTLLSELSIHSSIGLNLWQLLGVATRTAVAINLHRRDDIYLPTVYDSTVVDDQGSMEISSHNQRRKDLFWALYSIERLAAFILNRTPSLADADIDVDLPPPTMWPEGKYATLSSEALWVHHIQARRLYGQIQGSIYKRPRAQEDDTNNNSSAQEAVGGYMQQVQQWYMKSRFNSTVIPFSEESIKRHVLDDIQYHQMVIALHQPSQLIPEISSTSLATLYRSATLSVGLFHHAASRKQLNIHWINLHQAFTSCATLIYCLRQQQERADLKAIPESKVKSSIGQCREVMSLFEGIGSIVEQYRTLFSILIDAFESQRPESTSPSDTAQFSVSEGSAVGGVQPSPPGMDFDMDISFNPDMFPGMTESGLLDGPANILSPTYWMDGGQIRLERSLDGSSSMGPGAKTGSTSSGA